MPRHVHVRVLPNDLVDESYVGFQADIVLPDDLQGYKELWTQIEWIQENESYEAWKAMMRLWSAGDWYFRLMFVLTAGREAWNAYRHEPHFWHPVHIEIARWVQFANHNDEYLIASRGIGKSTHLTLNDDIGQKILDPNHASCLFSHTREAAIKHNTIKKTELERNALLQEIWDDRFWREPTEESDLWDVRNLNIKRATTRQEPSFSAHAFVRKLPTGMHFDKRYYDDIEEETAVSSEEAMQTIEAQYISSQDLSSSKREKAITGTYYDPNAMMRKLEDEYGMTPRLWPCEDPRKPPKDPERAGPLGGTVLNGFTRDQCFDMLKDKGGLNSSKARRSYGFQNVCDPMVAEDNKMSAAWIRYYRDDPMQWVRHCHIYICQDPSPGLDDPTWTTVWALHPDKSFRWIDGFRRRLSPGKRLRQTYQLALEWNQKSGGQVRGFRIESYGQGGYAEAQEEYNSERGLLIPVAKCADPTKTKREREYERWEPNLREGRVMFPESMVREDEDGNPVDLVAYFIHRELELYPRPKTDDGLDAGGLIWARDSLVGSLDWPMERPNLPYQDIPGEDRPRDTFMGAGVL